jgi:formylglycine-generating enzyme required for sulfatase activity/DNA-binding winged helix-turn-helix (wHTH) protein
MNQVGHRILLFDRFALDLTRGALRAGEHDIELRPKTFEVLRYLAENAGRLVSKQDLYQAVWPDVTVSDDSIAQCIRELRHKLGDDEHSLIRTVSRRGYLLDAAVTAGAPPCPSDGLAVRPPEGPPAPNGVQVPVRSTAAHRLRLWSAVAAGLLCIAWSAAYLLGWPVSLAYPGHIGLAENAAGVPQPRASFKDCEDCPEMVALPAGEFMMGSPASELGHQDIEGLPRRVVIPKRIAIGKFEVTLDQFSAFAADTQMTTGDLCHVVVAFDRGYNPWGPPEASYRQPGFDTAGSQPVVCISWHDAQAYVAWLRRRTGKPYRLPTEAEWEYAARAETRTRYSFGNDETVLCAYARFADLGSRFGWHDGCRSDAVTYGPLPVGSLKPNRWGIFDMHGNAWEWVEDCWTPNPSEIPTDGSAFARPGHCETGVIRGGSFAAGSRRVRSAMRAATPTSSHFYNYGFRVALPLDD